MQAPIRVAALLSAVWLAGCAATSVFNPYPNQATEYQKALAGGMPETALKSLDKKVTTRDGMLYRMERGRILQLTGNYEASRADFEEVGARFDQQDLQAKVTAAGSVTAAASLISNDNAIPYDGYLYERTYLHHFQVFNYLGLGDIEGATVELRKAALEQQMMEEAHEKEIAKAHAKQDDAEQGVDVGGLLGKPEFVGMDQIAGEVKTQFQNAYTFYTSAAIWEALGEFNSALVDYKKALELNPTSQRLMRDVMRVSRLLGMNNQGRLMGKDQGAVVILYEDQFVPGKQEFRLDIPMLDGSIKSIAFPYYAANARPIANPLRVGFAGKSADLYAVSDTYPMAVKALREEVPGMLVRQVLRVRAKHEAQKKAAEQNEMLGFATNIFNMVSEQADRRSWLTLPAYAQVNRLHLQEGRQRLSFRAGSLADEVSIDVKAGRTTIVRIVNVDGRLITQTFSL